MDTHGAVLGATLVAVAATVVPLLRHEAWWIRGFDFPRVQFLAFTMVMIAVNWAEHGFHRPAEQGMGLVLALCLVYQGIKIAPYCPLHPPQLLGARNPAPGRTFSILVANVYTPNRQADRLLDLMRAHDPDVVLAIETDCWWEHRLDALEETRPYSVKHPLDNTYGMHLYSRLALDNAEVRFLVSDEVPSIAADLVLPTGGRARLRCLHPSPPSPTENPQSTERDAELLLVARELAESTGPAIVTGDLNDVAWSDTTRLFQRISGLLDPRVGRGMFSTFHARYPLVRWPLDHVFVSAEFTLVSMERLPAFGSDHFPILARFVHAPRAASVHEPPRADAEDRERADDKIRRVGQCA